MNNMREDQRIATNTRAAAALERIRARANPLNHNVNLTIEEDPHDIHPHQITSRRHPQNIRDPPRGGLGKLYRRRRRTIRRRKNRKY